ncbi:MAG: hypothetical protein AAGE18_00005, partial [Pseudomonadota bacterium]
MIRTTHVGSLPRPAELVASLIAQHRGTPHDPDVLAAQVSAAVEDVVAAQVAAGVDIVSDGEMSKMSYTTYIRHRLSGFGKGEVPLARPADLDAYPGLDAYFGHGGAEGRPLPPGCIGPVAVRDRTPLEADLANFRAAVAKVRPHRGFLTAASPGVIALFMPNAHYPSEDAYVAALADAMRDEYGAVINAGFDLQVDAPDLAMGRHTDYRALELSEFRRLAARNVEMLNAATAGIPAERMRLHLCWGNYRGPHTHDVDLADILDIVLKARPAAILFEAANARHGHEHAVWAERRREIPDDKVLVPGVIDTNTNRVEHPELVAERLTTFAAIVGEERVIAGTDCGFATVANRPRVFPDLVWEKLRAQKQGAEIASARLRAKGRVAGPPGGEPPPPPPHTQGGARGGERGGGGGAGFV